MIGFVIVSHSARLAEGVLELAGQVAQGRVRLAAAGGASDGGIGTDPFRVQQAIESVYSEDGVLVFMDLGSAALSAETALEFLDEARRARVRLCPGPFVEGAVAAVSLAAAGAGIDEIMARASRPEAGIGSGSGEEARVTLPNRLGLHARPAAQLIRLARGFQAQVTIENVTGQTGPADAASINGILSLKARQGQQLRIRAQGPEASQALAALVSFIEGGCGDKEDEVVTGAAAVHPLEGQLAGIPASAGIGIGPLVKLRPAAVAVSARVVDDPEAERQRLLAALRGAQEETRGLYEWARVHAGDHEAGIFDAQSLFLEDPMLIDGASRMIVNERATAELAWQAVAGRLAVRADAADVAARVLRRLTGAAAALPALRRPSVLAAHDLTPSEVRELDPNLVLGLCLETGSASAHSVILARAMGIPAVVGLGPGISALGEDATVALDGERGTVWISPAPEQLRALEERRQAWLEARQTAQAERRQPAMTRDGRRIRVVANISGVAEAAEAVECGAEGVGVLRTEFLFLGRTSAPGEEEQCAAYRAIAQALGPRPLVIRTLDIGGDKSLPYVDIGEEANPFLGWRGIRVTLRRRDLLRTQFRAILRTGSAGPVEILLPMISSLAELRETKALLGEIEAELQKTAKVGVMIEVPAAVACADLLAREAGFFSIGTNDLVQYAMAADRTNARVAAIADPFQPAVLRMIHQTIEAGRQAGIPVTLCGEMAADPLATPLLLGMGLEEFSVSAPLVAGLKRSIGRWSLAEAEALAREALALDTSDSVRQFLSSALAAR